jgi:hypothetical protein
MFLCEKLVGIIMMLEDKKRIYRRSRRLGACLEILLVRMGFPFCLSYRYT